MVITFAGSKPASGARPVDPNRDFPQLVDLLKQVFAQELDSSSRHVFNNVAGSSKPAVMWRFDPFLSRLSPGIVWEEDGRIVGNVTLLPTKSPRLFIVANVAVQPEFRRRGIARSMMEEAEKEVRRRGGQEIRLQVAVDNERAKDLYRSLSYQTLGSMTTWKLFGSRGYQPAVNFASNSGRDIRELPAFLWQEAYQLDMSVQSGKLSWPDPLASDVYKSSWWSRFADALKGRHAETWVVLDNSERLVGLAGINSEWGQSHQFHVRIRADWHGKLEADLLNKLLRRLRYLPRRRVYMLHDADDDVMNELLPTARFRAERHLTQMRLLMGESRV